MICPSCKHDLGPINPREVGRCPYCNFDLSNWDPATSPNPSSGTPQPHPVSRNISGGVGDSILNLGSIVYIIGIIASVIAGIVLISKSNDLPYYYEEMKSTMIWGGLLVMGLGSLLSWLSTLLLRGFGQLVSDTAIIRQLLQNRK